MYDVKDDEFRGFLPNPLDAAVSSFTSAGNVACADSG
jgi:hypothetical protein